MPNVQVPTADPRDARIRELLDSNEQQTLTIQQQAARIKELEQKLEKLQALLDGKAESKASKKPVFTENYSLGRNKLQNKDKSKSKKNKKKPGRKPQYAKRDRATECVDVYPDGVDRKKCVLHRSQLAWRILDHNKAVYVRYDIYDLPDSSDLPLPEGVRNSRSEFGIEIIFILAFLHYWIGVSLDNACRIMNFFTGLELPKSQANSLLNQLADDWDEQYNTIAELIALQMIVYIDETGWKVGKQSCYTWVFSTELYTLFRCGVSRKKSEATAVLGETPNCIGVTDDYAAYKNMFSEHQLCWAHLLRKAIKLALQNPDEAEYKTFLDKLCQIYSDACESRNARRPEPSKEAALETTLASDPTNIAEIEALVKQLQSRVESLCTRRNETIVSKATSDQPLTSDSTKTFILLQRELVRGLDSLFVFVLHPAVEPTNNTSEQNARREAEIRKGARTSKTASGAARRSTIVTVLASLATRMKPFTLSKLLEETARWLQTGVSIFEEELLAAQTALPPPHPASI